MENIAKAIELKKELDTLRPLKKEDEARIMQKFRLDWNYHSNHLEGNTLTYGETKALLLFGITAQGKPLKDHIEITGHNDAVNWVLDVLKQERSLTESFIRELHKLILKEPYEVDAITSDGNPTKKKVKIGEYKTTPNHVKTKTGEIFRFATPEETPAKMHDLMEWYRKKSEDKELNLILLAAEFHYRFIRIHPFDDGNGRTARILMNFILMQFGYPPVVIKTEDKQNYIASLEQADAGIFEPFLDYIAANLCHSLELMLKGAKGESIEEPDDIDKEIKLLEKRFKGSKKADTKRTKENLLNIFNSSVKRLLEVFYQKNKLFGRFYESQKPSFLVMTGDKSIEINQLDELILIFNNKSIESLQIEYLHVNPLYGFEESKTKTYTSVITIQFKHTSYIVHIYDLMKIENSYSKQLEEKEIYELVNAEIKNHKKHIERKIAESQK